MSLSDFGVGTRGSALALVQAEQVRLQMEALLPTKPWLEVIKTTGDRFSASGKSVETLDASIQGFFTKELDEALLTGRIRAAIHSLKDVPTLLTRGLRYAAFLKREDCRDVLISRNGEKFRSLPTGARIGTSSPRREAQMRLARPDIVVTPLRGNLDTRLRKLAEGEYDAIVVAGAGIKRLGRDAEVTEWLSPDVALPAPAQGILAVVVREDEEDWVRLLKPLDDPASRICATAERVFLRTLQGGCRVPVGALAEIHGNQLTLSGMIADADLGKALRSQWVGSVDQPDALGTQLAESLLAQGAAEILKRYGRA